MIIKVLALMHCRDNDPSFNLGEKNKNNSPIISNGTVVQIKKN